MNEIELMHTIEARLTANVDLAQTLVRNPRATIQPQKYASSGALQALEQLRHVAGDVDHKVAFLETLGEGGMGIVHLATQATVGRHVAVKRLREEVVSTDAALRILREAWVTGALEHPNIVPVYDVGVDSSGLPVIIMKRVEGRTWNEIMWDPTQQMKLFSTSDSLEANIRIFISVCNAIHFAHSKGILHRDIKPENVMIGAFGEVYVLDWGIAVSLHDDKSGRLPSVHHANEIAGTPSYMAPEMLLGDPNGLSPQTDVYLLGAVFYEIFAKEPPHIGNTLEVMITRILTSDPIFPKDFPAEAKAICKKALSKNPQDRFASVDEFKKACEGYLQHRGSRKLAWDAKQSLAELTRTIHEEPPGEDRNLAVFNLLGECRFGYRAALSAWPDNESAKRGLDQALLTVIEYQLGEGDAAAAATLLREVSSPPKELGTKVDEALKKRAEEDDRLRKLEQDMDPSVGTRTRMFLGAMLGVFWTIVSIIGVVHDARGGQISHLSPIIFSAAFLFLGIAMYGWARESLTKTLLNRRISLTLALHLIGQIILTTGGWLLGITPTQNLVLYIFTWALTETLLAIWVETWFAVPAVVCAVSFLLVSAYPKAVHPIMCVDNIVLTIMIVKYWLPKQDIETVRQRREEIRHHAQRLFLDLNRRTAKFTDREEL